MIPARPLASPPHPAESWPVPTAPAPVWPQLPAQRQQQALLILAQMLLRAQAQEAGHEQPE